MLAPVIVVLQAHAHLASPASKCNRLRFLRMAPAINSIIVPRVLESRNFALKAFVFLLNEAVAHL